MVTADHHLPTHSRTHSIMRIATTASPVSGAEVRDRTKEIAIERRLKNAGIAIARAARHWASNNSNLQGKLTKVGSKSALTRGRRLSRGAVELPEGLPN